MRRIFPEQIGTMAPVKIALSQPGRIPQRLLRAKRLDLFRAGVPKTAAFPLRAHRQAIFSQRRSASPPHFASRMIPPAIFRQSQRFQKLQSFHSLFAEPLIVQHPGGSFKICVRKKCLHNLTRIARKNGGFKPFAHSREWANEGYDKIYKIILPIFLKRAAIFCLKQHLQ